MDKDKDVDSLGGLNEDSKSDTSIEDSKVDDVRKNNDVVVDKPGDDVVSDDAAPKADEKPLTEEQRLNEELGRIEGIDLEEPSLSVNKKTDDSTEEETLAPVETEAPSGSRPIKDSLDDDHETPVPFGNDIVEKARQEAKQTSGGAKKSVIVIVVVVLLAVLAAAAAVYFYYQQSAVNDKLNVANGQVDQLKVDNRKLQQQKVAAKNNTQKQIDAAMAEAKKQAAATAEDESQFAQIREFGVRYKLTDTNKTLIYAYASSGDGIYFTSAPLANLKEVAQVGGKAVEAHPCALQTAANLPMIMVSPTKPANATIVKQVGSNFFSYMQPQAACSTQLTTEQQAVNKAVSELVAQLEPIAGAATTAK